MATIFDRPFSRDYSGLRNQVEVGGFVAVFCLTAYEVMRHKRRGRGLTAKKEDGLGSVETWEFGYLYQGRCWAKKPSPALPVWPLAWVFQVLWIPERTLPDLIGLDATLYIRFLKACVCFVVLHTLTTFPVLFTLHVVFSPSTISSESMNKASIASLVASDSGLHLLYVHVGIAYWLASTWILTLLWIARGIFKYRALAIQSAAESSASDGMDQHPDENRGLRLRTVMVTNVPHPLRTEKALKEYFEYYLSRPLGAAPVTPGFLAKLMTYLFNRAAASSAVQHFRAPAGDESPTDADALDSPLPALVDRVIIARKTTELASLLARRDDVLKRLEYAHIRLARKVLEAARAHMENTSSSSQPRQQRRLTRVSSSRRTSTVKQERNDQEAVPDYSARLDAVTGALAPFILSSRAQPSTSFWQRLFRRGRRATAVDASVARGTQHTIWEALHSLPREYLDEYQPLIRLHALFRGATVPAIDYYAAKLSLLTALINENRGRSMEAFPPSSTAFVTFEKIADARRAGKYLQVHPRNPLACNVDPAPDPVDLDWVRIMKSSFTGEFLKDWVVGLGVWAFTCLWIIPISLFVGLVSIQNLSVYLPGLQRYLKKHHRDEEVISSLLPTILVSILTILIPMLLLLIAKKAHTIITLSRLHDTIMIRYWKFLVCNLLIFFCVGVAALETFLQSFGKSVNPFRIVASNFPTAGPFYVGWLILQTAIHGFLELGLFGLPLLVYPATRAAKTLRRRAAGIRPRTFNFYYWLPNHVLVITIVVCFALLNPLVVPFSLVYFSVEAVIVKHQLIHVYAKIYDNDGKLILIRIVRYSLDGFIFAQVVFLAFLVVLKLEVQAALAGILLGLTVIAKIILTRLCRAKFEEGDRAQDSVYSIGEEGERRESLAQDEEVGDTFSHMATLGSLLPNGSSRFWTWRRPVNAPFTYKSVPPRQQHETRRGANPFGPQASLGHVMFSEKPAQLASGPTVLGERGAHEQAMANEDGGELSGISSDPKEKNQGQRHAKHPLVTDHRKHPRWDDFPYLNRPYQNPYYVQAVDNFLWLPRDPLGVLDLDDSVDFHRALTSEPGGGHLGQWMNEGVESGSGVPSQPLAETPSSLPSTQGRFPFRRERQVSGTEEISMSSVLSARVSRVKEDEVERVTLPPSLVKTIGRHRSTRYPVAPIKRWTFSGYSGYSGTDKQPLAAIFPRRTASGTYDPVFEPDVQAESIFMQARGTIPESVEPDLQQQQLPHASSVPIQEALINEIMVEAEAEAADRVRDEEEEKRINETPRSSRWISFLWNRSISSDPQEI